MKNVIGLWAALFGLMLAPFANAQLATEGVAAITGAIDFATVVVGIGLVGAAVIVGRIALKGYTMLMSALKRG